MCVRRGSTTMTRLKTLLLAGAAVAVIGAPAHAQTAPAEDAPPQPADAPADDEATTVEEVVVTTDPTAGYFGTPVDDASLVPAGQARLGNLHYSGWLKASTAVPA